MALNVGKLNKFKEFRMKFTVNATIGVDVTATIEAEDEADAQSMLDSADVTVESCDTEITFNSACQINCDIDSVTCDAEQKWIDMDKGERMEMLKGNGVSDDTAYLKAGGDFDGLPTEWQNYFG
jgi:hypothetical protein